MDNDETIYLNYAGTSWPKPAAVVEAAASVLSLDPTSWPSLFQSAHETVAAFLHVDRSRLLLTPSCTAALNLAVMDHDWNPGDRVITSAFEHHALHRTMLKLNEKGIEVCTLPCGKTDLIDLDALRAELRVGNVRLLALTAACNVTGQLLPIAEAIDLAHEYGALVLIDGAQTTGWWDLDLVDLNVDLFTFAGHKAPHAPLGIGGLFVSPQVSMSCPHAACERADSRSSMQRSPMPGYCDAGSVNLSALAGMAAAVNWLKESEQIDRLQRARQLAREFAESIREWPGLSLHGDVPFEKKLPTVAVSIEDKSSADIAQKLRHKGLITSGGFQCAPPAHYSLGTDRSGVVRFSFGPKNQATDVARAVSLLSTFMR